MTQALREAIAARRDIAAADIDRAKAEVSLCDQLLAVIYGSEVSGAGGHSIVLDAPPLAKPKRKWTRRAFGVAGKRGPKAAS